MSRVCSVETHWWPRTPPVPHDPPGYVADDATCQCGIYMYAQCRELLLRTPSIGCGTFVPTETMEDGFYWYFSVEADGVAYESTPAIVKVSHTDPPPAYLKQGIQPEQVVWTFQSEVPAKLDGFHGVFVGPITLPVRD